MPFLHPRILKIAAIVRKWSEEKAMELGHPPDLCGMCGVSSYHLHRLLHEAGFKDAEIVYQGVHGGGHAYVKYGEHVIDVTATQFGHKHKVGVGREFPTELEYYDYTNPDSSSEYVAFDPDEKRIAFQSGSDFINHQNTEKWPSDQIAKPQSSSLDTAMAPLQEEWQQTKRKP